MRRMECFIDVPLFLSHFPFFEVLPFQQTKYALSLDTYALYPLPKGSNLSFTPKEKWSDFGELTVTTPYFI